MSTLLYFCFYSSLNITKKIKFVMRGGGVIAFRSKGFFSRKASSIISSEPRRYVTHILCCVKIAFLCLKCRPTFL